MKAAIGKLTTGRRNQLEKQELIGATQLGLPGSSKVDKDWWPWWEMQVRYYWTQHFPARGAVEVVHTYTPISGGSYIMFGDDGLSSVQPFCGGTDSLTKIKEGKARLPKRGINEIAFYERRIQYILTTANNWNGPISKFHLEVESDRPEDIMLTCMPGLQKTSPTRFELDRTDFRPDRDMDLLILQANE
jgi:hypothetical protein